MKNIDKIRQMNSEELAELLDKHIIKCSSCPIKKFCYAQDILNHCKDVFKKWLEQEMEE